MKKIIWICLFIIGCCDAGKPPIPAKAKNIIKVNDWTYIYELHCTKITIKNSYGWYLDESDVIVGCEK